jgi:hypothetical protein
VRVGQDVGIRVAPHVADVYPVHIFLRMLIRIWRKQSQGHELFSNVL